MPEFELALGKTAALQHQLETGKQITFISDSLDLSTIPDARLPVSPVPADPDGDLIFFTLYNNIGDIIFRWHIVRRRNTIAFNAKRIDGDWMDNKRTDFPDIHRVFGPNAGSAKVTIKNTGPNYQVYVNGNYVGPWGKFAGGDAVAVDYGASKGAAPVFAATVKVIEE